jgi:hypothetical protein
VVSTSDNDRPNEPSSDDDSISIIIRGLGGDAATPAADSSTSPGNAGRFDSTNPSPDTSGDVDIHIDRPDGVVDISIDESDDPSSLPADPLSGDSSVEVDINGSTNDIDIKVTDGPGDDKDPHSPKPDSHDTGSNSPDPAGSPTGAKSDPADHQTADSADGETDIHIEARNGRMSMSISTIPSTRTWTSRSMPKLGMWTFTSTTIQIAPSPPRPRTINRHQTLEPHHPQPRPPPPAPRQAAGDHPAEVLQSALRLAADHLAEALPQEAAAEETGTAGLEAPVRQQRAAGKPTTTRRKSSLPRTTSYSVHSRR